MIEYRHLREGNIQDILPCAHDIIFDSRRASVINILKSDIVPNYKSSAPTSQKTHIFFTVMTSRLTTFSEPKGIYSEDYAISGFSNVTAFDNYRYSCN